MGSGCWTPEPEGVEPYLAYEQPAMVTSHGVTLSGLTAGTTYYFRVTSTDASGNAAVSPATANAPLSFRTGAAAASGLVAAYGFNEGTGGGTVNDASGSGNHGTIRNAGWSTSGRFGGALSFNGTSSWVTVNDAASLDLTKGMTLEAWVRPSSDGVAEWRAVLLKEGGQDRLTYALHSNSDGNRPRGSARIGSVREVRGTTRVPPNAWTHLAVTYDGSALHLYVNGTLVDTRARSGE